MTTDKGYSGNATEGAKYADNPYISAADIAKHTRKAIRAAQKDGTLPADIKFRVTSERYAGGSSVAINLHDGTTDTSWAMRPVDPTSQADAAAIHYGMTEVVREDVKAAADIAEGFAKAYTREDIDSMVDYFNVSVYVFTYLGWYAGGGLVL